MAEAAIGKPAGERWLPVVLSFGVHALLVAMLGWGWWSFKPPMPAPRQLAIEATVVQETSRAANPAPQSGAPPPPAPLPADNTAELERQAREQAAAEAQKAAEAKKAQEIEQERQVEEEARREDAKRVDAQKQAHAKAEAKVRAQEKAKHEADQRRVADQKRQADEAARKAHDAEARAMQERTRRESDLKAQLASEERINAARGSADAAAYRSMIQARIERNWIRPGTQHGVNCQVRVTQVPGGEVTGVQITSCNGDAALRESIEAAVYRASPLPTPTNPDLFDRNLVLTFHPDD